MRKLICLVLTVILTLTIFVGCGNGTAKPSPEKEFDLSGLEQAMYDALGNAPKNFKYENIVTDDNGDFYIRRIQYRDGDKLKYWEYDTEKYVKDEKGAGGHFEFVKDYSKKTESDIKDDEWTYADKYDRNFYVLYFGWANTPTAVKSFFDDVKVGRKKFVKAENGVYGFYFFGNGEIQKKPYSYSEYIIENGIQTKSVGYALGEDGLKTDKIDGWITQTMFGEVSFEIPDGK